MGKGGSGSKSVSDNGMSWHYQAHLTNLGKPSKNIGKVRRISNLYNLSKEEKANWSTTCNLLLLMHEKCVCYRVCHLIKI